MLSGLQLAFFHTTTWDRFLHIIKNFEKYEIYKTLKQKVGSDLRGSGPHSGENPKKIDMLDFEIWHYGGKFSGNLPEFSNYFSVFILHSFYVSHSRLIKFTKSFHFVKYFKPPKNI